MQNNGTKYLHVDYGKGLNFKFTGKSTYEHFRSDNSKLLQTWYLGIQQKRGPVSLLLSVQLYSVCTY